MPITSVYRCARCKQFKAGTEFAPNPRLRRGLHSWCRECVRDYAYERVVAGKKSAVPAVSQHLHGGNALEFSRAVCEHLASYADKKIRQFEAKHKVEAPPHLVAIRAVARSFVAQHPEPEKAFYLVPCVRCEKPFVSASTGRLYCDDCRVLGSRERGREKARRRRTSPVGREQRRVQKRQARARAAEVIITANCLLCGAPFQKTYASRARYCGAECRDEIRRRSGTSRRAIGNDYRCARCLEYKPESAFGLKQGKPRSYCWECERAKRREWKQSARLRNREVLTEGGAR